MEIDSPLIICPINNIDCLRDFYCGVPNMDEFIHNRFQLSLNNHYCKAYVVKHNDDVIAMFALSFDSIDLDADDKEELAAGISNTEKPDIDIDYNDIFYSKRRYPALDIAYLAVRKDLRGQGIGESLIQVIAEKAINQDFAGCQFISVEALKTQPYNAVGFYDRCGFAPNELPNPNKDTLRMFKTLYV